jgi:hypothetical protein
VKDILRLPILLLFLFIVLFIVFFALSVFALWGSVYSEGREAALRVVEADVPDMLVQVLPAAVLVSLFILLVHIAATPGSRFLSLLIPLAGAFVLLAFGYQILQGIDEAGSGTGRSGSIEPTASRYLVSGVFNTTESKVIYMEQIDANTISPVVLAEGGSTDQKLLYFPQGRVSVGERSVAIRMAGYTLEIDPEPVYGGIFSEDRTIGRLFADLQFLNQELRRVFQHSLPGFYFAVMAIVIAFYGSGMFLRLSRWHLLNLALALLSVRAMLALFRFISEGVLLELEKVLQNPQALQFLPEVVLFVVGGLLLLLDLLFVPFRRLGED